MLAVVKVFLQKTDHRGQRITNQRKLCLDRETQIYAAIKTKLFTNFKFLRVIVFDR
jgi:hypothetical protein